MIHDPIKKSYKSITILFIVTGTLVIILGLIFPTLGHIPMIFLYILPWLLLTFSQYNNFILLNSIYRAWGKTDDIERKEVLGCITYKNIYHLKKFKQDRKKDIKAGNIIDEFTFVDNGTLGCIFYGHGKTNTYTYVIIIGKNTIITIPPMFGSSIYPQFSSVDTNYVKKLFSDWADENGYKIEHLLLYKRDISYDPDITN